jgi:hypothetical protein
LPTAPYSLEQAEESIADLRAQVDRLGEVHALDGSGGVIPNAQPGQVQKFAAADGQPGYVTPSGLVMGNVGSQNAFFPNNTATAASLTSLASWTVPAGDAAIGAVYEIEIWGSGQQGSTKQALGLQVVLGGNNLASVTFGAGAFQTASNLFRFRIVGRGICHTTGAGGTWTSYINAQVSDLDGGAGSNPISAGNQNFATATSCESTTTQAIDTTAAITLGVSAAWGSVTGAPTLTSRVAIAKRIC